MKLSFRKSKISCFSCQMSSIQRKLRCYVAHESSIQARDAYQQQVEFSTVEIEKKNKELLLKIREMDTITKRYESVLENMQGRADEVSFDAVRIVSLLRRSERRF